MALNEELKDHDCYLDQLTQQLAPESAAAHSIVAEAAAEILILVGGDPERIHPEASLARLCGACSIPASGGKSARHRLIGGSNRQAKAALYRVVIVSMRAD